VTHLRDRCRRAVEWATEDFPDIRHFVVAGGVAANSELRSALELVTGSAGLTLVCPPPLLCTDNGIMVAWAGIERWIPLPLDNIIDFHILQLALHASCQCSHVQMLPQSINYLSIAT